MKKRNPKQEGTILYDCVPQHGPCPNNCNQCYYNISFYAGHEPLIPEPRDVAGGIVRMNSGHDSNIEKDLVLETAKQYEHIFFNTSIPELDFPGPVVLTVNPKEEDPLILTPISIASGCYPQYLPRNLMFVRLRTSPTNLENVLRNAILWDSYGVPVILTLMRYKTKDSIPEGCEDMYEQKVHIDSEWFVPTRLFWLTIYANPLYQSRRLIHTCGSVESNLCIDCCLCIHYYGTTLKRLQEDV